jgi:predicted aspartyl protease
MSEVDTSDHITCKYLMYPHGKRFIRLPLLHVHLKEKNEIQTDALVDSGATATFIPNEIADVIGLLPETQEEKDKALKSEATAATSSFPTYVIKLAELRVIKGIHVFDTFREMNVHIPRTENIRLPYVVLGRNYLFKHFDITFHENRHKMSFQRVKTTS